MLRERWTLHQSCNLVTLADERRNTAVLTSPPGVPAVAGYDVADATDLGLVTV